MDFIDDQVDLVICIIDQLLLGLMGWCLMCIDYLLCVMLYYLQQYGVFVYLQVLKEYSCIYFGELLVDVCWCFCWQGKIVNVEVWGRYVVNYIGVWFDVMLWYLGIVSLLYFIVRLVLEEGRLVQVLFQWSFKICYCGELWVLYLVMCYLLLCLSVFVQFLVQWLVQELVLVLGVKLVC